MRHLQFSILLIVLTAVGGCAGFIKGVTNTSLHTAPKPPATFTIEAASGETVIGRKIAVMLDYQMQKLGFAPTDSADGDVKVLFDFDVVPAGTISRAQTFLYHPSSTSGSTVSTATTTMTTTRIYEKSIAVRMIENATNKILWEGITTEEGWCNQIVVTAPAILVAMFEEFPKEKTNARRTRSIDTPEAKEFKALFPNDTNWGC